MRKDKIAGTRGAVILGLMAAFFLGFFAPSAKAMTEKELLALYLDIVEQSVSVFEPLWVDDPRIPNSGFFDFRKYDDWTPSYKGYAGIITIPGNGLADFCYAVLLTETDKPYFSAKKIPRKVLLDHALRSLRWCCLTSVYVKNHFPYIFQDTAPQFLEGQYWRREFGYRADEVGFLTLAAAKLWSGLNPEVRGLVEEVLIGGAPKERFFRTWQPPQGGNQDQVKQDLSSTVGAAYLFPGRPDQSLYRDIVAGDGLDMVSTLHDFARPDLVEGKPLSAWAKGWNLYQDYSSDHHGWAQIWYGCDKLYEGYFFVDFLSRMSKVPMPGTYTYPRNGFDGVLDRVKLLCLPEGEPVSVHGMEYDSYYGSGLLGYLYGAVIKKDPVSAALEERAAWLLNKSSRALPVYDYHRNNWGKAALAYLTHKSAGPRAEPVSFADAWAALEGTAHHRWWQNLFHRAGDKLASFSWGTISSDGEHFGGNGSGVCGYVIPAAPRTMPTEPLVYMHPFSMTGEVEITGAKGVVHGPRPADHYEFFRSDAGFRTAGRISLGPVAQSAAFFSFESGPCVFLNRFAAVEPCRLSWSGVPIYFYARAGLTSSRIFYDGSGERPLEKAFQGKSNWWSVGDRLGAAVSGGTGEVEVRRTVGRNWARTDAYKDACDTVFLSALRGLELKAGDACGDIAVAFFPETPHAAVEAAGRGMTASALKLPEGWKGVLVPGQGGRRYLAVARFEGTDSRVSLPLSFPEGAPALSIPSLVSGKEGTALAKLDRFGTLAETLDVFVEVRGGGPVEVRRASRGTCLFRTPPGETAQVLVRFLPAAGGRLRLLGPDGGVLKEFSSAAAKATEGVGFPVTGEATLVDVDARAGDHIGPAVEIREINVREDGRVTAAVEASDQSGIRSVGIDVDGRRVANLAGAPWIWSGFLSSGYHTFRAVAVDDSPGRNFRESDPLTAQILNPARINEK